MSVQIKSENLMKAVSVTAHCKQLAMSRSQYYWHAKKGTFHSPLHLPSNNRPYLTAEMVNDNLEARQTGIGVNGEYVLFYERQPTTETKKAKSDHSALLEGLKHLGLIEVSTDQLESALAATFPNGTDGQDQSTVLRSVFRYLKRSNAG